MVSLDSSLGLFSILFVLGLRHKLLSGGGSGGSGSEISMQPEKLYTFILRQRPKAIYGAYCAFSWYQGRKSHKKSPQLHAQHVPCVCLTLALAPAPVPGPLPPALLLWQRSFASLCLGSAMWSSLQSAILSRATPKGKSGQGRGRQIKFNLNASVERHTLWDSGWGWGLGKGSPGHPERGTKSKLFVFIWKIVRRVQEQQQWPRTWCMQCKDSTPATLLVWVEWDVRACKV